MVDESIGDGKMREVQPGSHAYALKPGDLLGQYEIIRTLGAGGMGEVYEVEHQVLRRRYALKLLPQTLDWRGVSLERFQREAQVMANLEHPNILKVDDFGEIDGRYWLRMEIAEGIGYSGLGIGNSEGRPEKAVSLEGLAGVFGGKVPQEVLLPILRQILEGLQYAHQHGAIHHNLKPSNILLAPPIPDTQHPIPKAKISDFGLVRLVGKEWVRSQAQLSVQRLVSVGEVQTRHVAERTSERALLGTYEYMSPEQKRGEEADERSDLYAVGLMTYRLLTGRTNVLKLPSRVDRSLHVNWDEFIEQALEEEMSERLRDAGEGLALLWAVEVGGSGAGSGAHPEPHASARGPAQPKAPKPVPVEEDATKRPSAAERSAAETDVRRAIASWGDMSPARRELVESMARAEREAKEQRRRYEEQERLAVETGSRVDSLVVIELVEVKAGSFQMGTASGGFGRERPVRTVKITRDFWMGKYEVTQKQYRELMGSNPSNFKGDDLPVETVSWEGAVKFCEELTRRERSAGRLPGGYVYRLPTEAEWEYAARGGQQARETEYAGSNDINAVAWHSGNSGSRTQPVGRKATNELGLHDMSGNVWEWVHDRYQDSYAGLSTTDPMGPASGPFRVYRGGSWGGSAARCRVAYRNWFRPSITLDFLGFRVVLASVL